MTIIPAEEIADLAKVAGLTVLFVKWLPDVNELLVECGDRRLRLDGETFVAAGGMWRELVARELHHLAGLDV